MSKQAIELKVSPDTKEFVLREGAAREDKAPKSIIMEGTLQAPAQFLDGKKDEANPKTAHIRIMNDKGILELHLQDIDPFTEHIITGKLRRDSAIDQFKINSDFRWTIQLFLKFIKTMRFYFADATQCQALVSSLQKWSAKVEMVIKEHQDTSGNSMFQLEKKVGEVEMMNSFVLNIPIYQGYSKAKFKVEIGLDPKSSSVDLYLISDELIELEIQLREKYIEQEIKKLEWFSCSKITIS